MAETVATPALQIHWSRHAIERARQRFGFRGDIEIPNERIIRAAMKMDEGEPFDVATFLVTYCCVKEGDTVTIKTVKYSAQ